MDGQVQFPAAFPGKFAGADNPGMDLCDWFAGMALVGLIGRVKDNKELEVPVKLAQTAYAIGQQMCSAAKTAKKASPPSPR